jgi:hypothetical protein
MKTLLSFLTCGFLLMPSPALRAGEVEASAAFPGAQGNYGGIVQTGDGNFLTAGALVVLLEATGRYTANLNWEGLHYPFVGKFDAATATFNRTFLDRSEPGSKLALGLKLNAGARTIDCTLEVQNNGSTTTSASGQLSGAAPDANASAAHAGTLNTSFINPPSYGSTPQEIDGDGFSLARVSRTKNHAIRVIGRLPDTAALSCGSVLRGSTYTVFNALYRSQRGVGGQAYGQFDASDPNSLFSTLLWAKRAGADPKYYAGGFNTGVGLNAVPYALAASQAIPHISTMPGPISATLSFTDGNLGTFTPVQIKISAAGVKVFAPNPSRIALHVNATGASWAGTFIHPVSGKLTSFHGAFSPVHDNMNGEGRGNFKGSVPPNSADLPESGSVRITVN